MTRTRINHRLRESERPGRVVISSPVLQHWARRPYRRVPEPAERVKGRYMGSLYFDPHARDFPESYWDRIARFPIRENPGYFRFPDSPIFLAPTLEGLESYF